MYTYLFGGTLRSIFLNSLSEDPTIQKLVNLAGLFDY